MKLLSSVMIATFVHSSGTSAEEFTDPEANISICYAGHGGDDVTPEIERCIRRYDPGGKLIVFQKMKKSK